MKYTLIFILTFILSACSNLIEKLDQADTPNKLDNKTFSIVFSNNINGETHPCGCRNFPLGGLPQVAGLFHNLEKENKDKELFYVDTGDTFFPSSSLPYTMKDSLGHTAKSISKGLDQLGLKFMLPGDQDFAMDLEYLKSLQRNKSFRFLISNLTDESILPHEKIIVKQSGKASIFFLGLIDPEIMKPTEQKLFVKPFDHISELRKILSQNGHKKRNKHHRLIVLSHAGLEFDKELAQKMPEIDWIIGSHSQSFMQDTFDVNNTKIVQALSRNHYIGEILIGINSLKGSDSYKLHPVHEELDKTLSPNPLSSFIVNHKNELNQIQLNEQMRMGMPELVMESHQKMPKFKTAVSCIECHSAQSDFWMSTPHANAFSTLLNVNEANNMSCIGCHSLGLNDPKGYTTSLEINNVKKANFKKYWDEAKKISQTEKPIRELDSKAQKELSVEWFKLDKKHGVTQNFANVQCLNCHGVSDNHPKVLNTTTKAQRISQMKNQCLSCHTPDQSPEWFDNGIKVNAKFDEAFSKVSCPSL